MDIKSLWKNILDDINKELSPMSFNTWFKETNLIKMLDGKAIIEVPMPIHKKLLSENYYDLIEKEFFTLTGTNYDISFVSNDEIEKEKSLLIGEENVKNENESWESNLLSKYSFENFVTGDSNMFAHTASIAVAQNPGKIYNPFFIHGKSGLGKTHLMHAIGNYIIKNSNKTVLYITADEFITDFTGLSNHTGENNLDYINKFKKKYRSVDVLMVDDIQFLGGAEKTQKEFFNTFNALYDADKQIVISSDKSPDDLKLLEDRLRTRFAWGLTTNIYPPDFELKCNIIKNKIMGHDVANIIDSEVIEYMANNCENDVRHIEGAVTRLYAFAAINNVHKITYEFAQDALKDIINKSIYFKNDMNKIQNAVANYYNLTIEDLKSKKRSKNVAYPRQIGMYLCRMMTSETWERIGLEFGGKDHSTVIHACDKITKDIKENKQLNIIINDIKNKIV